MRCVPLNRPLIASLRAPIAMESLAITLRASPPASVFFPESLQAFESRKYKRRYLE